MWATASHLATGRTNRRKRFRRISVRVRRTACAAHDTAYPKVRTGIAVPPPAGELQVVGRRPRFRSGGRASVWEGSGEDADATGADEQTDDDQHDAPDELPPEQRKDAGDH